MSTQSCDFKLASDMIANCENPVTRGVRNNGYIINVDDVDFESCTIDETNPNIISSLVLKSGKKAYSIYVPGKTPFTGTNKALAEGTYRNTFTKQVSIVVLDNGPDVVNNIINPLANGQFIVILENKFSGTDGKNTFEVFGYEQGLTANALTDEKYSEDTDGGWAVTLQEDRAPSAGLYLYNSSVSATRTAIASLVAGSTTTT